MLERRNHGLYHERGGNFQVFRAICVKKTVNPTNMRIYLDHNATSPLRTSVKEALINRLGAPLNPSSVHQEGRQGRKVIEAAREKVAALVGADPKAVVFTSGGTEANNMALSPRVQFGSEVRVFNALFVSAVEHPCILAGGRFSKEQINHLPVDESGIVDLERAAALLADIEAPFVSVMLANNETGVIQPIDALAEIVHGQGGFLHVDAVQAAGKIPIDIFELEADSMTVSAHKIGGPQGVGALIRRQVGVGIPALMTGGGQELGYRGGTENVAGIEGFGIAAEEALLQLPADNSLQTQLEQGLKALSNEIVIFAESAPRLPNTTCFSLPNKRAETAVIAYDMAGVAVSSGSACSSGKVGASHVLEAMGVPQEQAAGAIRVSTGWNSKAEDIEEFIAATAKLLGLQQT